MVSERKNWENCREEIIQENLAELKGTHFQMEIAKFVLEQWIEKRPTPRHIMKFQYNGDKNKNLKSSREWKQKPNWPNKTKTDP